MKLIHSKFGCLKFQCSKLLFTIKIRDHVMINLPIVICLWSISGKDTEMYPYIIKTELPCTLRTYFSTSKSIEIEFIRVHLEKRSWLYRISKNLKLKYSVNFIFLILLPISTFQQFIRALNKILKNFWLIKLQNLPWSFQQSKFKILGEYGSMFKNMVVF